MFIDSNAQLDANSIRPQDIVEWFPELEHRDACRVLWEWKARSNGRHSHISKSDVEGLLGDLSII